MPVNTLHRGVGAAAVAALALALAACGDDAPTSGEPDPSESTAAANLTPHETLIASVAKLSDDSYTRVSHATLNGMDFLAMTEVDDGDTRRTFNDLFWSILPDALGLTEEEASFMGDFFTDSHTERIVIGDTVYLQFSGSDDAAIADEFGEDVWFTQDSTEDAEAEAGVTDVGNEELIGELTDVTETGDGAYAAVLPAESATLQELVGASGTGEESAPVDAAVTVELDEDGVFQRMSMELPESDGIAMTLVSEITETGVDYDIKAPDSTNLHTYEEYEAAILAA